MNIHVSKWDPNVDNKCTFCQNTPETTLHFLQCPTVMSLCKAIKKWLSYSLGIMIDFSKADIVLNNDKGPHAELVNMYLLVAKFYLYRACVQQIEVKFPTFLIELNKVKNIEKTIARMQNKTCLFCLKWSDQE